MAFRDLIPFRGGEGGTPSRFEPTGLLGDLQREVNHLFESFPRGWSGLGLGEYDRGYVPDVDVEDLGNSVKVEAELPGLTEKDVEVTISPTGDAVTIKGEKKMERERKEEGLYRRERSWGAFQRMVTLPAHVNDEKVEATFKNGVLSIILPKMEEEVHPTKKIPIKAEH